MPKDISRLSPFSSAPGCFQEAHRGQRQTLATYPVLSILWGEDTDPQRGLALWSHQDIDAEGGNGLPKVTQRMRRAPASQIPLFPSFSQGHHLRSLRGALTPRSLPTARLGAMGSTMGASFFC